MKLKHKFDQLITHLDIVVATSAILYLENTPFNTFGPQLQPLANLVVTH